MNFYASLRAALESHLVALRLAATGSRGDIAVAGNAYLRDSGSFLDDGFRAGDTVLAAGFAIAGDNGHAIVTAVAADRLAVDRPLADAPAGATVSVTATLPAARKFEGQPFPRPIGGPWLRVSLKPAGDAVAAFGAGGVTRHSGALLVELCEPVAAGLGLARVERLAAGLRGHFRPGTAIERDGVVVRIRGLRRAAMREARDLLTLPLSVEWFCDAAD